MAEILFKLGIDWKGLLLYLINFGVLFYVLSKLLYRPITKMLDERRKRIQDNLREAEQLRKTLQQEMDKQKQAAEATIEKMKQEKQAAISAAKKEAKALRAKAEEYKVELVSEAQTEIKNAKARLVKDVEKEVQARVSKMVTYILKDKVPENVVIQSAKEAWDVIKK